jgi:hypothetical protein
MIRITKLPLARCFIPTPRIPLAAVLTPQLLAAPAAAAASGVVRFALASKIFPCLYQSNYTLTIKLSCILLKTIHKTGAILVRVASTSSRAINSTFLVSDTLQY